MKVLVVHNEYRSELPSGENVVVHQQVADLEAAGVTVVPYLRSSDELVGTGSKGQVGAAASALGAGAAIRELRSLLRHERPDVVHLHNLFPLISPRIVSLAHRAGVPVVQTAHNFRHVCAAGTYFRDGHECFDCRGRAFGWPAVRHACYRGSPAQSAVLATALAAYRPVLRAVDRMIALAPHVRDHLVEYGVPAERIVVIPNSAPDPGPPTPLGTGVLFAGRFAPEKGLRLLADAWSRLAPYAAGRLTLAGDGPERPVAIALEGRRPDVEYVGHVEPGRIPGLLRGCAVVVVPSLWADVCPTIVVQALASGRPVLSTDRGGLPYLVQDGGGWLVPPTAEALAGGLLHAVAEAPRRSASARATYESRMAPAVVVGAVIETYRALTGKS